MEIEISKKIGNNENLGNRRYLLLFRISNNNFAQVDYLDIFIKDFNFMNPFYILYLEIWKILHNIF